MPVIGEAAAAEVCARAGRRLAAIDPLLPEAVDLPAGCGVMLAAGGADGSDHPAAVASCERWEGEPGPIHLACGAAPQFQLNPPSAPPRLPPSLALLFQQSTHPHPHT